MHTYENIDMFKYKVYTFTYMCNTIQLLEKKGHNANKQCTGMLSDNA